MCQLFFYPDILNENDIPSFGKNFTRKTYSLHADGISFPEIEEENIYIYAPNILLYLVLIKEIPPNIQSTLLIENNVYLNTYKIRWLKYKLYLERWLMGSDVESPIFRNILWQNYNTAPPVFIKTWLTALKTLSNRNFFHTKKIYDITTIEKLYKM